MWVAVWVERVRAEISLSVTILSRVPADTLSANPIVATAPELRPGGT